MEMFSEHKQSKLLGGYCMQAMSKAGHNTGKHVLTPSRSYDQHRYRQKWKFQAVQAAGRLLHATTGMLHHTVSHDSTLVFFSEMMMAP